MPSLMHDSLAGAIRGTERGTAKRMRALASVRWILATEDGYFVTVDDRARVSLTHKVVEATVYDGRDNEELKSRFMEVLLKVPLTVVLLDE